jgi:beta-lactam-binding protein with PASTA domain
VAAGDYHSLLLSFLHSSATSVSRTFSIAGCSVPRVIGKRLAIAKGMIARKHCRTGKITHANSRTHTAGIVISQSRRPGRALPNNAKIDLVVSRGRR